MKLVADIVSAVQTVTRGPAALHEPEIRGNEWKYVKECLDTEWVSTSGAYVSKLEKMLAEITGARNVIAVVNGTAALHATLLVAGIKPDQEVLVPALTFAATANSIVHCGAVPHFVDVEVDTMGVDPHRLESYLAAISARREGRLINKNTGRPIAAMVCVHIFGHPVRLDELKAVCARYDLPLIEDGTESLGSQYKGQHTGTIGHAGILSFNGNKIVTTGGGGAILTNDDALAAMIRHVTSTSKVAHPWEFIHDRVGYNYRMPNLNAALGCGQLERLEDFLDRKRRLATAYAAVFEDVSGASVVRELASGRSNYWLNAIVLDGDDLDVRDVILRDLNAAKLMSRPLWRPLHMLNPFRGVPRDALKVTEELYRRVICLPSSPRLVDERADARAVRMASAD